jgi:hypothetical protein
MRKLLIALALMPAMSHAALVIDNGAATKAASTATTIHAAPLAAQDVPAVSPPVDVQAAQQISVAPVWKITPADVNFQRLFARWAKIAGWTFLWEVDQDIPLVGVDTFNGSFTDAVLAVAHSTDGTDMPIHPCFYTNNLVRIVPVSVVCNPDND